MSLLRFTKMHGLGNDFVVIDAINQSVGLTGAQVQQIADRRFGVGCDQLLLVERPQSGDAEFRYRIFNADGGEVEQCGNGARCFARFVHDKGLTDHSEIRVETAGGLITLQLQDDDQVTVDMGAPVFEPARIPFVADSEATTYTLDTGKETIEISAISMGNPHAVTRVDDLDNAAVDSLGPAIESHTRFPNRVNAGFMQVMDMHHARLRVYERGAGETLACGTGACAAAVTGIRNGWLQSPVTMLLRGGELVISWSGDGQPVLMTGPAVTVFEGELEL